MTATELPPVKGLPKVFQPFSNLFRPREFDELPPSTKFDHRIDLKTGHALKELKTKSYGKDEQEIIQDFIDVLLSRNLIEPSEFAATSEIVFDNDDGHLVPRVSFHYLNDSTEKSSCVFPVPLDIIQSLDNSSVFTKLVVQDIHEQILLDSNDAPLTTFSTPFGKYQYKTMPFGLKNATATIQTMVEEIASVSKRGFVLVYHDNILVFSRNPKKHVEHVRKVLKGFQNSGILLDISKCKFRVRDLIFLGFRLRKGKFGVTVEKCREIAETPHPVTRRELKSFLGKTRYWSQFIPGYAGLDQDLSSLILKKNSFNWDQFANSAFKTLKEEFSHPLWLHIPDKSLKYIITTQVCDHQSSATLSQGQGLVLGNFSHVETKARQSHDLTCDHIYGILLALEYWKKLLENSIQAIEIRTDCTSVSRMNIDQIVNSKGGIWYSRFAKFDFYVVEY